MNEFFGDMNHCWRTSQDDCTNDDENNWVILRNVTQANQQKHSLQLCLRNEETEICIGSERSAEDYPRLCQSVQTIHGLDNREESSSSSQETSLAVSNVPHDNYRKLCAEAWTSQFIKIDLRRGLKLQKNRCGRFHHESPTTITMDFRKLNSKFKIIRKKKMKHQLSTIPLRKSLISNFPEKFIFQQGNSTIRDTCNVKLHRLQIAANAISGFEKRDLIEEMSALSCNHNIFRHRDRPEILISEDTISFQPDLEETLKRISLGPKVQDFNDDANENGQSQNWSIEIDEIDQIKNLSIQDENEQIHHENELPQKSEGQNQIFSCRYLEKIGKWTRRCS